MASDLGGAEDGETRPLPGGFGAVIASVSPPVAGAGASLVGGAGLRAGRGAGGGGAGTSGDDCGNKLIAEVRGCGAVSLPEHEASIPAPTLSRAG